MESLKPHIFSIHVTLNHLRDEIHWLQHTLNIDFGFLKFFKKKIKPPCVSDTLFTTFYFSKRKVFYGICYYQQRLCCEFDSSFVVSVT